MKKKSVMKLISCFAAAMALTLLPLIPAKAASNAGYGDDGSKWNFTGSYLGYAQYDDSLLTNTATYGYNGTPCYMRGNVESKY